MCPKHSSELDQNNGPAVELMALPQLRPSQDAWPFIERQMNQPGRARKSKVWWLRPAMAAVLVLSLGMIILLTQKVDEQDQALQAWIDYSQELELELRQLQGRNGSIRGHQAMAIGQLEDMVAAVDWHLAKNATDDQRQLRLWQRRASLLNDLVTVRASQRLLPLEQQLRPVVTFNRPVVTLKQPVVSLNRPAHLVSYEL